MVHRWPWAFRSIWRAVFLASLYIFVILCISLCWLASGWPMGGQQSKCAACCGDKDESGQRVFILLGYETIVSILRFVSSLDVHWSFVVSMVWGGFSVCHPPAVQHSLADFDNLCFNIPDSPFVVFFCVSWLSNDNFALWLYLLTLLRCGRRHSKFEGSCREFCRTVATCSEVPNRILRCQGSCTSNMSWLLWGAYQLINALEPRSCCISA